ncbi:glycosyltransferase family 4 protein [Uliginosibacterium sp. sgz301328]|uniref:glycosyltransferase family 4 protein n=1 Tax=Uliginosibacterium sp. sgz301328 TaxID=3243764 RepID=UPI00359D6073
MNRSAAGFNVIGYLGAAMGLGVSVRMLVQVLREAGHDVVGLDIDGLAGVQRARVAHDIPLVSSVEQLPFRHNIMCAAVQTLPAFLLRRLSGLLAPRFRNAAYVFWELPAIPRALRPALALFDATLAGSQFTKQAIETSVSGSRSFLMTHALPRDLYIAARSDVRRRFGLPEDAYLFCASFDLFSGVQRKNPEALIEAFTRAFPPQQRDAHLVLKCNGDPALARASPLMRRLLQRVIDDGRVHLIIETLDYADVMGLYGACDAYLSFHRAEGLGLGAMEAMWLGLPVIATGYSGNMDFMNARNSILLPYRLVSTAGAEWHYSPAFCGRAAQWADVDVAEAAQAMRRLHDDANLGRLLGARARRDIAELQDVAWTAPWLPQLQRALDERDGGARRAIDTLRLRSAEWLDPVLLRLNAQAAMSRVMRRVRPS